MKNKLSIALIAISLSLSSCVNYDAEINKLNERLDQSEKEYSLLQRRMDAFANIVYIVGKTEVESGYKITFSDGSEIIISDGVNGQDGVNGVNGISVEKMEEVDGKIIFYFSNGTQFSIDAPENGSNGTNGSNGEDGDDGTNGSNGSNGVSVISVEMDGNFMVLTMSDGSIYRLATNQTQINDIVTTSLDNPGANSFLVSDDVAAIASYRWTANGGSAVNISAPIYMHAVDAGSAFEKTAEIALRDLENKLTNVSLDDLENLAEKRLRAWDIAGVLYAYEKTGEIKYLNAAERVWDIHIKLYELPRNGSINYFGFDMYGAFKAAALMAKYSTTYKAGAEEQLASLTVYYDANIDAAVDATNGFGGSWHFAFYGLIKKEFGIGKYSLEECASTYYADIDFATVNEDYAQDLAYATLAYYELSSFDVSANANYFNDMLSNNKIEISEVLVEALHANHVLATK